MNLKEMGVIDSAQDIDYSRAAPCKCDIVLWAGGIRRGVNLVHFIVNYYFF